SRPDIAGLAETGYLTNESVFSLTALPSRLAVIGSGPIGCELAQAFARFGAQVTVLERGPQVMSREDPDAAACVAQALAREGVKLLLSTGVLRAAQRGHEKIVQLDCAGQRHDLFVDEILVGVGRTPNVEGLGLDEAGVRHDRGEGVVVDDHLRTTNPRIFA